MLACEGRSHATPALTQRHPNLRCLKTLQVYLQLWVGVQPFNPLASLCKPISRLIALHQEHVTSFK